MKIKTIQLEWCNAPDGIEMQCWLSKDIYIEVILYNDIEYDIDEVLLIKTDTAPWDIPNRFTVNVDDTGKITETDVIKNGKHWLEGK